MALLVTGAVLLAASCSSDDGGSSSASSTGSVAGSAPGTTTATVTDEQRLAEAKTVAVGFFEAQAVNDHDQALDRSSGAAALTIEWARAVNAIEAAADSGYQVPSVEAPNVRVQIDALTPDGADLWVATGFVELSFRPGPVVSTTSSAPPSGAPTTQISSPEAPATYAVDLVFSGEGDELRLADYRLDDVPYPVSQLFTAFETPTASASDVEGTVVLGHRDLDGSVQYVVDLTNNASAASTGGTSAFTPAPAGTTGTVTVPADANTVEGTTFADPLPAGGSGPALVVFPGAFPGSAGTLTLAVTTDGTTPTGGDSALAWALPDFPQLTPRPVGTVTTSTSTSTTTSTSSTTTSSTATPPSTSAPTTAAPPTSGPTSTSPSSTTSSTSTTTTAP